MEAIPITKREYDEKIYLAQRKMNAVMPHKIQQMVFLPVLQMKRKKEVKESFDGISFHNKRKGDNN